MFEYSTIMAAGKGKRMIPLTKYIPKALVMLNGKPLISYSLEQIIKKIPNIAVTTGHCNIPLIEYSLNSGINILIDTNNKENAWWVFNTLFKEINKPVLVLTCDNLTTIDIEFIYLNYLRLNSPPCMIVPVKVNEGIQGDYIHQDEGKIDNITPQIISSIYGSGIQVINPKKINRICKNILKYDFYAVWEYLIKESLLYCSNIYPHDWFSVNTVSQLNAARLFLSSRELNL